jgi:hypothetical protein
LAYRGLGAGTLMIPAALAAATAAAYGAVLWRRRHGSAG